MGNSRILIHHHAVAFVENERIWIQSFIGVWIQELSQYFDEIGLLVQVSNSKKNDQDYAVFSQNVKVHRLNPSHRVHLFKRNQHIRQICQTVSPHYDILLIRGITPRQKLVFDNCAIAYKCFLLVGSLIDSQPVLHFNKVSIITWLLYRLRRKELQIISRSARMFANSPALVQEISTVLGVQAGFIPTNTISKSDFRPLVIRPIEKPAKLLFCGRVVKEKGIEELIDAIRELIDRGLHVSLEVIGSITENYKFILSDKIAKLNLGSQIRFHGFIPFGDDLLQFYSDSDIYVLPSWHEGFPHSIWEAAATCTPVIITPVGGIPGIIGSDHVLFCKVRDTEALVNSVINCLTNLAATNGRIKNLYHLAIDYTIENCAEIAFSILTRRSVK